MLRKKPVECTFCTNIAKRELSDDLDFFSTKNQKIYLCDKCHQPFNAGSVLGQVQLNNKVLSMILSCDDESPLSDLKEKIIAFSPQSKTALNSKKENFTPQTPKDFYDFLCKRVIGQEYAKKRLSLAVFEHIRNAKSSKKNDKQNILLLGPSGSGKTLIVNSIAKNLDIPYVMGDSTSISPTGFQGADSDSIILDLFLKTDGDISLTEQGLVFFDEVDKLATQNSPGTRLESFNYATQSTLLKLIEGKKVRITGSSIGEPHTTPKYVDTTGMLFCFGGAFNGLEKIVAKKLGHTGKIIGFRQEKSDDYSELMKTYEIYEKASHDIMVESLIEYGLTTELVGRIQTIAPLAPLDKNQMLECLENLEDSPIRKNKILFAESNIELDFSEDFKSAVVEKAIKSGTGTRALNSIVKTAVSGAAFQFLGSNISKKRIIICKDTVENPHNFEVF